MSTPGDLTFYVTYPIGGPLADCYTTVSAPSELQARLDVIAVYGTAGWSGIYGEHERARSIDRYDLRFVPFGTGRETSAPVAP